eukprot:s1016_g7.t1
MAPPESWRKTGRKAGDHHWIGSSPGELVEAVVYDDQGRQQGTVVLELTRCEKKDGIEGEVWMTTVRGIQDAYFAWWVSQTYPDQEIPVHFCGRRGDNCQVATAYRDPLHIDVFRLLPGDSALQLSWLSNEEHAALAQWLKSAEVPPAGPGQVPGSGQRGPDALATVETGEAGIRGLAAALGSGGVPAKPEEADKEEGPRHGQKRKKKDEELDESYGEGLQRKIAARSPPVVGQSALRLALEKKKKKKRKAKAKESKSSGSESSDRSDSLFQLAALPAGTEKIHRLHEERPGALANLTLLKFREILERTVGLSRGTADKHEETLPPVARGYLSQILLTRVSEQSAGVRNVRELRTLAAIIDGIGAST